MGLGSVGLQTNQKKEQSGAPFAAGSADNGLSVDTTTGRIVLGNDVADPLAPAQLLSNREIATSDAAGLNLFSLSFNDLFNAITTALNGGSVVIADTAGISQAVISVNPGGITGALMDVQTNTIKWKVQTNTVDATITSASSNIVVMRFQQVNPFGVHFSANSGVAYNSATVQISGTITSRRFCTGVGAGTTTVDRDLDSGKIFFNSGARILSLPNMAAANARVGFNIAAACNSTTGITFQAETAQTIRFGSLATSVGGALSTTDLGAFARIVLINSSTWFTETFNGAWTLT